MVIAGSNEERRELYRRGKAVVELNIAERIKQLAGLAGRMQSSQRLIAERSPSDARLPQQRALLERWQDIESRLLEHAAVHRPAPEALQSGLRASAEANATYTAIIRGLDGPAKQAGREWLANIAEGVAADDLLAMVPPIA